MKNKLRYSLLISLVLVLGLVPQTFSQDADKFVSNIYSEDSQTALQHSYLYSKVNLNVKEVSLRTVLAELEEQLEVRFSYSQRVLDSVGKFSAEVNNKELHEVMDSLFSGTEITYLPLDDRYIVLKRREAPREILQTTITGAVIDAESGETLPGANVSIQGTTRGSSTDEEGVFSIQDIEPGTYTLVASFIGYQSQSQEVTVSEGQDAVTVNFELQRSAMALDEMVVVGYGTQQRGQLTGSVSSINMEQSVNAAESSLEQTLQGRVSGVQVVQTGGGKPGGGVSVNIRGIGSINAESPLYVIDGVPIQDNPSGQTGTGILNTLNPNDIQSVDILKDASAAAIYGSRASGGVVLITTKEGSRGPVQVNFESSYGTQIQPERYDVLNAEQYESYLREVHSSSFSSGLPDNFENGERPPHDVDWQDELFRAAPLQNYNLDISGGGENSTYSLGLGYFDQEGTIVGSSFDRYSLRAKTRFSANDNISFGGSVLLSKSDISQNDQSGGRRSIEHAMKQAPTVPVYDESFAGGFGWPVTADGQDASNPIANAHLIDNSIERYSIVSSAYTEINFLENFTYKLQAGVDFRYSDNTTYNDFYEETRRLPVQSSLGISRDQSLNPLIEQTLTYNKSVAEHDFSVLAGFSAQSFSYNYASASGEEMPRNVRSLSAASAQQSVGSGIQESSLRSLFGRVTYSYDNRYLLTSNIRRDESSKLYNSTDPIGIFPSVSLGWRVSEEQFMENADFITDLKLRAGWGEIGNQSVLSNYPTTTDLNTNYYYVLGGQVVQGIGQQQMANSNITWETSVQTDIGFTAGLLDDKLSLDFDYYIRKTEDLIWRAQVPSSVGLQPPFINGGTVENKGVELAVAYQNTLGDVNINLSGNFTTINNEVLSLGANDQLAIIEGDIANDIEGVSITRVGEPIGQFYGYVTDGIFQNWDEVYSHASQSQDPAGGRDEATAEQFTAPGDIRFADLNGDGVINSEDKTIIGNPIPDFTYGFTADLAYKNFDFNLFLQGNYGNDIYNGAKKWLQDFRQNFNQGAVALDAWSEQNTDTDIHRISALDPNANMSRSNDRFVEDGSYLRIKTMTLGYTINNEFVSQAGVNRLRVYATARNLLTLTGYSGLEPEIGSLSSGTARDAGIDRFVYPQAKQFVFGLQLGF